MEKTVKISILGIKREFKMEKTVKTSIFGIKREFKMETRVKISILRRKKEFKMEKIAEISILRRKREFKMEKTVKISISGIGKVAQTEKKYQNFHFGIKVWVHFIPIISYNKNPLISGNNSKIVISEKSILSNYPKLHKRGKKI